MIVVATYMSKTVMEWGEMQIYGEWRNGCNGKEVNLKGKRKNKRAGKIQM